MKCDPNKKYEVMEDTNVSCCGAILSKGTKGSIAKVQNHKKHIVLFHVDSGGFHIIKRKYLKEIV